MAMAMAKCACFRRDGRGDPGMRPRAREDLLGRRRPHNRQIKITGYDLQKNRTESPEVSIFFTTLVSAATTPASPSRYSDTMTRHGDIADSLNAKTVYLFIRSHFQKHTFSGTMTREGDSADSPGEVYRFLLPSLSVVFPEATLRSTYSQSADILSDFISNPDTCLLIAFKADSVVFQTSVELREGPVFVCQKPPISLTSDFRQCLNFFSFPTGQGLFFLQMATERFFLPFLANTVSSDDDALITDMRDDLSKFALTARRWQRKSELPQPVLNVPSSLFTDTNLSLSAESATSFRNWHSGVEELFHLAANPPSLGSIHEFLDFWAVLARRLQEAKSVSERIAASPPLFELLRNYIPSFQNFAEPDSKFRTLLTDTAWFQQQLAEYPRDFCDRRRYISVSQLIEPVKSHFLHFFSGLADRGTAFPELIPVLYGLSQDSLLREFAHVLRDHEHFTNLDGVATVRLQGTVNTLFTEWTRIEDRLLRLPNIGTGPHAKLQQIIESRRSYVRRFNDFLKAKLDFHLLSDHISQNDGLDNEHVSAALREAFQVLARAPVLGESVQAWTDSYSYYERLLDDVDARLAAALEAQLRECTRLTDVSAFFRKHAVLCTRIKISESLAMPKQVFADQMHDELNRLAATVSASERSPLHHLLIGRGFGPGTASDLRRSGFLCQLRRIDAMMKTVLGDNWRESIRYGSHDTVFKKCSQDVGDHPHERFKQDLVKVSRDALKKPFFRQAKDEGIICSFDSRIMNWLGRLRTLLWLPGPRLVLYDSVEFAPFRPSWRAYLRFAQGLRFLREAHEMMTPVLKAITAKMTQAVYEIVAWGKDREFVGILDVRDYPKQFCEAMLEFRDVLVVATGAIQKTDATLNELKKASTEPEVRAHLGEIMRSVDTLLTLNMSKTGDILRQLVGGGPNCLLHTTNSDAFLHSLNSDIAGILAGCVSQTCASWKEHLLNPGLSTIDPIHIGISLSGNHIVIQPPIELLHPTINRRFTAQVTAFVVHPQLRPFHSNETRFFQELVPVAPEVNEIYGLISRLCDEVRVYVDSWVVNESLFRLSPDLVSQVYGEQHIAEWVALATSLQEQLVSIQAAPIHKTIGFVIVDTGSAQRAILDRLARWDTFVLRGLRAHSSRVLTTVYQGVLELRSQLEQPFPTATRDLAAYLAAFRGAITHRAEWDAVLPTLERANALLDLPDFPKLQSCLEIFDQLLSDRRTRLEASQPSYCAKVKQELEALLDRATQLSRRWQEQRPLSADILPRNALTAIADFRRAIEEMQKQWNDLDVAGSALGIPSREDLLLQGMLADCAALSRVWTLLDKVWERLTPSCSSKFMELAMAPFKELVLQLLHELEDMPEDVREYEAWERAREKLHSIQKLGSILEGLRTPEVLQERHWREVSARFNLLIDPNTLTLQGLLDLDLHANHGFFLALLQKAQGEHSLRQGLRKLDDTWNTLAFEFTRYKRTSLVTKVDVIVDMITDNLGFLSTMKASQFFPNFQREALQWESELNTLVTRLDDYMAVQRSYVYLDGVFSLSDMQKRLGATTGRFQRCEHDFLGIARAIEHKKIVKEAMSLDSVANALHGLHEKMSGVQKELSGYLEVQRGRFPRFYFIGDEDLLEIIGKSSSMKDVQRHFGKMFDGLLGVRQDGTTVVAMTAGDAEVVPFLTPAAVASDIYTTLSGIESEMRKSLQQSLATALGQFRDFWRNQSLELLRAFLEKFPSQVVLLALFVVSTESSEKHIIAKSVRDAETEVINFITLLSRLVFADLSAAARHSVQQLITESVHHRNLVRDLAGIRSTADFEWTRFLRYYSDQHGVLKLRIGNAEFDYGYEYLGLAQHLVRTPLTDRVYLTLAQALHLNLGGSPRGPAGTGKTETVKNMGHHLGRHVLVFNCDETFDFRAMGRIFVGLCDCGAWGCFDEFNRLDEQMLSAVSQQIQTIQTALRAKQSVVQILDRRATLMPSMGIFITMNPGYAGRVELPDNLKQLFRTIAMNRPDTGLITEVLLFSQGFASAEKLAPKFVALFSMAQESLSHQKHYDFGLRAMKSVLTSAGQLIRDKQVKKTYTAESEGRIVVSSVISSLSPKLSASDLSRLQRIMTDVFRDVQPEPFDEPRLTELIKERAHEVGWVDSDLWLTKVIQIFSIQQISHGFMLVGPSGTGKTSARKVLLRALESLDNQKCEEYVINPKTVTKDTLFGSIDPRSREWRDGVFTRILRTIVANQRNEMNRRHWIVFDGDVDPEWVENLNNFRQPKV
jgi:dynein heavy chain 1